MKKLMAAFQGKTLKCLLHPGICKGFVEEFFTFVKSEARKYNICTKNQLLKGLKLATSNASKSAESHNVTRIFVDGLWTRA